MYKGYISLLTGITGLVQEIPQPYGPDFDLSRYMLNKSEMEKIKEYVASLIGLYKNNGAVSCVAINFLLTWPLYLSRTRLVSDRST